MPSADAILTAIHDRLGPQTLLEALKAELGPVDLVAHWTQGEFHHDLVFTVPADAPALGDTALVVSTNCNGGVKELLCLAAVPDRFRLWQMRCPGNPDFQTLFDPNHPDAPIKVLGQVRSVHWFNPHRLLTPDARSELRVDQRRRQRGGGWVALDSSEP
jgi:hypothetical protein